MNYKKTYSSETIYVSINDLIEASKAKKAIGSQLKEQVNNIDTIYQRQIVN